jgi:beta-galactosidase
MRITTFVFALILIAFALGANAQRINKTINSGWLFHKGEIIIGNQIINPEDWSPVNLPHTWNNEDAFDDEPGFYQGTAWYAKSLSVPQEWKNNEVFLHFEGANQETEVYLNGKKVGIHVGGYTAFGFNLSPHLNFGGNNLLTVRVNNAHNKNIPPLRADFTFYGGIYRNVRLIVTEAIHFDMGNYASDGVFTDIQNVSEENADVSIKGRIVNSKTQAQKVRVETQIIDKKNKVVASENHQVNLAAGEVYDFLSGNLLIQKPNLWSPDNPYLYNVIVRIYKTGAKETAIDEIVLPLGLRWFEFDKQNRFVLNGKPLKLIGTNRHQDLPQKGNALSDYDHRNDFKKIRELGFNFVRLAHYPQAQEVYRMCDKLGLLVWSEIPIVNRITQTDEFTQNCLNMQREHIRQTRSHPSVVLYGYMNEVMIQMLSDDDMPENEKQQVADATVKLARRIESLIKEEAPDRKTVMAIHYHEGYNKYGLADVTDVLGWNLYFGWYYKNMEDLTAFLSEQHELYPDRPLIVSEYGPGADIRNHTESPVPWDYSEDYQIIMHQSYLQQMMNISYLAGFAAWNFADFGSERRKDAIPHVNQKGLVNFDRSEKAVCDLYRAWFSEKPVLRIALRNYTTQSGIKDDIKSGTGTHPVKIFSSNGTVELRHNGHSLGKKKVDSHVVEFEVPFTDGLNVLEAVDNSGLTDKITIDFNLLSNLLLSSERKEIAVNVGSPQSFYDPASKVLWMPDRKYTPGLWGYEGGAPLIKTGGRQPKTGISDDILGTENDPLFQTFNEGIENYRFDVAEGLYEVTVCFVEPNSKNPEKEIIYNLSNNNETKAKTGTRIFSMEINGLKVLNNLNLAKEFGPLRGVDFKFQIYAKDNDGIKVKFLSKEGDSVLSAIRVKPI